jgi:hypothetical protein
MLKFYQSVYKRNIYSFLVKTFLVIVLVNLNLQAQISPGDLTKAHSYLEGMSNCTKCHELGEQVTNSKCMDCHSEIKKMVSQGKGYHSSSGVKDKNCFDCHSEHNGRNFKIINFNPNSFDHKKAGYELTGSHTSVKCNDCHQAKYISTHLSKKKKETYLGLSTECRTCHEDIHQPKLGTDCSSCHTTEKFKPAEKFNHNKARFALTGSHQKVECNKCHPVEIKNDKKIQKFKGVSFSSCKSCHNDTHKGKFGNKCESCHNTSSFHNIAQGTFDHNKTNFPLIGKHKLTSCNNCHKTNLTVKLKHDKCLDCHTDYHKGDFVVANLNRDCSECHSEDGFKPASFTIEKHNLAKFSLTGAHLAVTCQNCHYKEESWHFRNIGNECIECHKNVHGNELTPKFLPENKCNFCHVTENWKSINFNHSTTDFVLTGKHQNVSCGKCHTIVAEDGKVFQFASSKSDCVSCHKDIHCGQFNYQVKSDCLRCHSFDNWKPEKFDHEKTKFSLSGAHSKLLCSQCHKLTVVEGNTFVKYRLEDFKCASCHS